MRLHGVSAHLVWLLQVVYSNQTGQITGHSDVSREFCIKAGVRQGCALSPRLFCSVLQLAMQKWRSDLSHNGLDLGDGGPLYWIFALQTTFCCLQNLPNNLAICLINW